MKIDANFPEKLRFLFFPMRYKIARGGRGSSKSWSFARAILILGASRKLRILCAREIQDSIDQSVHQLLKDQIKYLKLEAHYKPFAKEIRGANGTLITYSGLSDLTNDQIKSFEAIDICWVEEGQALSDDSWKILIPTIRKDPTPENPWGSEIWVSYNPDLDTDPTHDRFYTHQPDDCINALVNWRDNPWFPETLERERQYCKKHYPDDYDNIWEGQCRPAVAGAIYYKQMAEAERLGRICNVPYDPLLKVHVVFDLGWEDSLGAGLVQRHVSEVRIIEYIEASHTTLDIFSSELKTRPYNWGKVYLPHDGFSGQLNSKGKSSQQILQKLGWKVPDRNEIVELSIEEGIRTTRLVFPRLYFDKTKVAAKEPLDGRVDGFNPTPLNGRLVESLKRYRRNISKTTKAPGTPVKDEFAHGADTTRYISVNADIMTNEDDRPKFMPYTSYQPLDTGVGM